MPVVKPISDLQRNLGSIAQVCHETGEPVYLTRNGSASLVVMDADEFDRQARALSAVREREERVQRAIARGYDDMLNGRTRPWAQAKQDADRIRAARNAE
ncbi:type II toxin-antitoxin system Phd/YefM family antitoxin [Paratractidigestivibacter sp.]|uniref:type II toxin-antitoxin system Phd/YefM family antitoxin n=1 Tax=Paratractidigestivibacter sp. TaxID=2847316 RepID=UPI002ABE559A|nr:type II toxin-antitoxin system Phd/YefM family antitoxin [Paratractidigestivibacter sp.]